MFVCWSYFNFRYGFVSRCSTNVFEYFFGIVCLSFTSRFFNKGWRMRKSYYNFMSYHDVRFNPIYYVHIYRNTKLFLIQEIVLLISYFKAGTKIMHCTDLKKGVLMENLTGIVVYKYDKIVPVLKNSFLYLNFFFFLVLTIKKHPFWFQSRSSAGFEVFRNCLYFRPFHHLDKLIINSTIKHLIFSARFAFLLQKKPHQWRSNKKKLSPNTERSWGTLKNKHS